MVTRNSCDSDVTPCIWAAWLFRSTGYPGCLQNLEKPEKTWNFIFENPGQEKPGKNVIKDKKCRKAWKFVQPDKKEKKNCISFFTDPQR